MSRSRRSKRRNPDNKGLRYSRIYYRPGFGVCRCPVCTKAAGGGRYQAKGSPALGSPVEGCEYVNREQVFAEAWERENIPSGGDFGILQDNLFKDLEGRTLGDIAFGWGRRLVFKVTGRERVIVATIVQWLGSNVGWCFLEGCIRACGYRLVREEDQPKPQRPRHNSPEMAAAITRILAGEVFYMRAAPDGSARRSLREYTPKGSRRVLRIFDH